MLVPYPACCRANSTAKEKSRAENYSARDFGFCMSLFSWLHLDFYFNTTGEFELHQGIYGLGIAAVDVDETLVGGNLELLAALLVDEGGAVHGDDTLASGEGDRTAHDGTSGLHTLDNLVG